MMSDERRYMNIAKTCLSHMCDPSLVFQHVAILDMETRKKHLKSHESNIYEQAAELLSNIVDVKWGKVNRTGSLKFTCKLCSDFSVAVKNGVWEGQRFRYSNIRTRFLRHLSNVHPSNCQSLASQLEVAPGKKLKALLFEAMIPHLHDVWGQMIKLNVE